MEEIDIIYAKSYADGTQAWRVAANLPKLSYSEVEDQGNALGLFDDDLEKEEIEMDEDADRENDTGANNYTLFQKKNEQDNNQLSGDGSSSSQKTEN